MSSNLVSLLEYVKQLKDSHLIRDGILILSFEF